MSAIQMTLSYIPQTAEIPCAFIDDYMPVCVPVYALIYIYGYRQCAGGKNANVSTQEIARIFNILETDVANAWRHWENEGLIKLTNKNGEMQINFLPVTSAAEAETAKNNVTEIKSFPPVSRPQYTVEELSVYRKQCKDIEKLFTAAEQTLGKLLTYHDMNVLFGLYDWLRLPLDVIQYLLTYCADHGHRNLRYIEKAALDWADNQIDDLEKALHYVQGFDRNYRGILQAMGQTTGYPTPSQRKYINKWLTEFQMPAELVMEACDRAAMQIGKPKFTYVDKIITDWHNKGLRTMAGVEADTEEYRKKTETVKQEVNKPRRKNRFVNFKQREWDVQQLEKMEREYLLRDLMQK
jgi:DnaD/phage-associated family protein